jgi:hypothetical protein
MKVVVLVLCLVSLCVAEFVIPSGTALVFTRGRYGPANHDRHGYLLIHELCPSDGAIRGVIVNADYNIPPGNRYHPDTFNYPLATLDIMVGNFPKITEFYYISSSNKVIIFFPTSDEGGYSRNNILINNQRTSYPITIY